MTIVIGFLAFLLVIAEIGFGALLLGRDTENPLYRAIVALLSVCALGTWSMVVMTTTADALLAQVASAVVSLIFYVWVLHFLGLIVAIWFYFTSYTNRRRLFLGLLIGLPAAFSIYILTRVVFDVDLRAGLVQPFPPGYMVATASPLLRRFLMPYFWIAALTNMGVLFWATAFGRREESQRAWILLGGLIVYVVSVGVVFSFLHPETARWGVGVGLLSLPAALAWMAIRLGFLSVEAIATEVVLESMSDGVLILSPDGTVVQANRRALEILNLNEGAVLNRGIDDVLLLSPLPQAVFRELWRAVQRGEPSATGEFEYGELDNPNVLEGEMIKIAVENRELGYLLLLHDVSEVRRSSILLSRRNEELQRALRELEISSRQQESLLQTVRELSTPVVPMWEGIIVIPLVGFIDSERAQQIMDGLLDGIRRYHARVAILDITGVPVVDTSVANYLLQSARAAELMGCHPVLVGIRPEIAQTLVELGVDLRRLVTRSDLQGGIEYAWRLLGLTLPVERSV